MRVGMCLLWVERRHSQFDRYNRVNAQLFLPRYVRHRGSRPLCGLGARVIDGDAAAPTDAVPKKLLSKRV